MSFVIFLCIVSLPVGIVFHEAGHWLVCVLLGIPTHCVQIGAGPILLRRRIGTTALEVRQLPLSGKVAFGLLLPIGRMAHIVFYLGGALGNAAAIGVVALATCALGTKNVEPVAPCFVFAQITIIAANLLPWRGRAKKSDGYQIIETLIRGTKPRTAALRAFYAERLAPYRDENSAPIAFTKASCRVFYERRRFEVPEERVDAAKSMLCELDRGEINVDEELLILDSLIGRHVMYGDLEIESRLEGLTARAARLAPDNHAIRVSCGAALLELGRTDEAAEALAPVIAGPPSPSKSLGLHYLARAAYKRGDTTEACRLIDAGLETLRACEGAERLIALAMQAKAEMVAKLAKPPSHV